MSPGIENPVFLEFKRRTAIHNVFIYYKKIKYTTAGEIEHFAETHLRKL